MKILKARDIMRRDVASIGPQVSAADLAEFFNEEAIHGAPVVDSAGQLLGMVSRSDLVRALAEERPQAVPPSVMLSTDEGGMADLPEPSLPRIAGGSELTVSQIMTPDVVTATPESTVGELAALMHKHDIRRLAIVENRRMEGIVSVTDLLPVVAAYEKHVVAGAKGGKPGVAKPPKGPKAG
jgi:CBS domain-containing protein